MLQIKKTATLTKIQYSMQPLLRWSYLQKHFKMKKSKQSVVFVRAPKNFNIGKQKINSLKYKIYSLTVKKNYPFNTQAFLKQPNYIYISVKKYFYNNVYLIPKSMKVTIETKFTIKFYQ